MKLSPPSRRGCETRNAIAALGASGSAIVVARLFTGPAPHFVVTTILGFKTPFQAILKELGKDVQIRFS